MKLQRPKVKTELRGGNSTGYWCGQWREKGKKHYSRFGLQSTVTLEKAQAELDIIIRAINEESMPVHQVDVLLVDELFGICRSNPQASRYIYFVETVGVDFIKIGIAANVGKRLKALSTTSVYQLKLRASVPGDQSTERLLHGLLARHRQNGEWFVFTATLKALIERLNTVEVAQCL